MKKRIMSVILALALLFVCACGGSGKNKDSGDSDTSTDSDISDDADNDGEVSDNDGEISDNDGEVSDNDGEVSDNDGDTKQDASLFDEIVSGLDDSFLEPNKGFALKIAAPLLQSIPDSYDLTDDEYPYFISGSMIDEKGRNYPFKDKRSSFAANYQGYLYVTANSEYTGNTYYSASIMAPYSSFDWMFQNDVDEIGSKYFYVYLFEQVYVSETLFRSCPKAVASDSVKNLLKLFMNEEGWLLDEKFGFMMNVYLSFDEKSVEDFMGGKMINLCTCYDINGSSMESRACKPEELDLLPTAVLNPKPENGAENQPVDLTLSWDASTDPDGGEVTYTVFFGTKSTPDEKVAEGLAATSWKPASALSADTTYYWQVVAVDDEGNSVKSDIWVFDTNTEVYEVPEHDFLIVADPSMKNGLEEALSVYTLDLEKAGYKPFVRWWHAGGAGFLKEMLKQSYTDYALKGALLLGRMPSAYYEQESDYDGTGTMTYESFPCEYYLMDLDGEWKDADSNGIFDDYPTDLSLEIFTSRITGSAEEISEYLLRTHEYRENGSFFEPRNFFSFIDDDWNSYEENGEVIENAFGFNGSTWGMESIYGDNYDRLESRENTTKTTYLDYFDKGGAEFVYQWIHSDPQELYFNDNYSPNPANILTIEAIRAADFNGSFYNLFNCSASKYTEEGGNLADTYLKGKNGLATVGSTKVGGMFNPEAMYEALVNGESWGAAYQTWANDLWANYKSYGFNKPYVDTWWLGMMIQGDPTLTLTDKKAFSKKKVINRKHYSEEFLREMERRTFRRSK